MRKAGVVPCNFLYFPHKVRHYQINLVQEIISIYVQCLRILLLKHKALFLQEHRCQLVKRMARIFADVAKHCNKAWTQVRK